MTIYTIYACDESRSREKHYGKIGGDTARPENVR